MSEKFEADKPDSAPQLTAANTQASADEDGATQAPPDDVEAEVQDDAQPPAAKKRGLGRRLVYWTLEGAALCVTLGLVSAGALVWHMQREPLDISYALPHVEAMLEGKMPQHDFDIKHASMSWVQKDRHVLLKLSDVSLTERQNPDTPLLQLPVIGVELDGQALFRGVVQPRSLTLYNPDLRLGRTADGALTLDLAINEDGQQAANTDWRKMLGHLTDQQDLADGKANLSSIETIRLADGSLKFDDQLSGQVWQGRALDLSLERDDAGIFKASGTARMTAPDAVDLTLGLRLKPGDAKGALDVGFTNLRPELLARLAPDLGLMTALDMPLTGNLSADFVVGGKIERAQITASGTAGTLTVPMIFPEPVALDFAQVDISHDGAVGAILINQFTTRFGPVTINATGHSLPTETGRAVRLSANAKDVPFEELAKWWPLPVAPYTRDWVIKRITDGQADATTEVQIDFPVNGYEDGQLTRLDGTMTLRDMTVNYATGLPVATGVSADVTYDDELIRFDITGAKVAGLNVTGADIAIGQRRADFPAPVAHYEADHGNTSAVIHAEGSARDVMDYLDNPLLGVAATLGLKPEQMSGQMRGTVKLGFPLVEGLDHHLMTVSAEARLTGAHVTNLPGGHDLSDGDLNISFADGRLQVDGGARVKNQPVQVDWRQWGAGKGPNKADWALKLIGDLDGAARESLFGHSLEPQIKGSTRIRAEVTGHARGQDVTLSADLEKAAVSGFGMAADKPAGAKGQAALTAKLRDGGVLDLTSITLDLPQLLLAASGRLQEGASDKEATHGHISVETLRTKDGTNVGGRMELTRDGALKLRLSGPYLDLTHLPEGDDADKAIEKGKGLLADRAMEVSAQLGHIRIKDRPSLGDVVMAGHRLPDGKWRDLTLKAGELGGKIVDLRLSPEGGTGPAHDLSLTAANAAELLQLFGKGDVLKGGRLRVTARWPDGLDGDSMGRIRLEDFVLADAPGIARFLSALTVTGLGDALSGDGLGFSRFTTEFELTEKRLTLRDGRAAGNAFGLSIEGHYLRETERLNMQGTIVPAQTVNSVLGAIPLLGTVLTGGEGGGLFAASFTAKGKASDPKIAVNPLSTLAPGIIRRIFFVDEDLVADRPVEAEGTKAPWDRNDR